LIILTTLTVSGPTVTPDQLLNILRLKELSYTPQEGLFHRTGAMRASESSVMAEFPKCTMDELQPL
jgi:hypothetical protein